MAALKRAANPQNFLRRVEDIHVVLDQLERWNSDQASSLAGRLDLKRIGMSGHSFGALTTQAVSGQHFQFGDALAADSRIKAAIMFSPSSPRRGDPKQAFGRVHIPWMLMTGTKDVAPIGDASLESRLAVFPALPPGGKYELVLEGAEHSAFSDRSLPGDTGKRNPNHHRAILALSTAFWDAYLQGNAAPKIGSMAMARVQYSKSRTGGKQNDRFAVPGKSVQQSAAPCVARVRPPKTSTSARLGRDGA